MGINPIGVHTYMQHSIYSTFKPFSVLAALCLRKEYF